MSIEKLRFSTAILRLLGEELNPHPDQGILELVKNAYDADATECTVELLEAHLPGGSVRVRDNGSGMLPKDIRNGWLVVGESIKSETTRSSHGRLLVGSKGLGRLSALRLGSSATLVTRPEQYPEREYCVVLDWKAFDRASLVEQVEINIEERIRKEGTSHGTEILIENLPFAWKQTDVRRLARALLLLTDPFERGDKGTRPKAGISGFHATLEAEEFAEIARRAREGYWSECDFHLVARIDRNGKGQAEVFNGSGEIIFTGNHEKLADPERKGYNAPALTFEVWEFLLDRKRYSTKAVKFDEVQGWLKTFGGVYLYHRGVRVAPYGDPGNDWLDMNLRRVRNPELRPSTNNSIGRLWVEDPKGLLHQKTDRFGFLENEPFRELVQFASDALEWMAGERLRAREKRRQAQKKEVHKKRIDAESDIQKAIANLPSGTRVKVELSLKALQSAQAAEMELLYEESQLYHTLGTVGTTAAAFAHQTNKPLRLIHTDSDELETLLGDPREPSFPELSKDCVRRIRRSAKALSSFSQVTLMLLEHEKRRKGRLDIHSLIRDTVDLLRPYFQLRNVAEKFEFDRQNIRVWGSRAAFESVITNLITNSLQAFITADARMEKEETLDPFEERLLLFRTRLYDGRVRLDVMDNGPGIDTNQIALDDIWLPGKTTTERGTGLGLAIVKDVVTDLGGDIEAVAKGELGGAQFTIDLPAKGS